MEEDGGRKMDGGKEEEGKDDERESECGSATGLVWGVAAWECVVGNREWMTIPLIPH